MGTPHNNANKGDIAKIVLMPGDPLRAKLIAETYLEDAVQYTTVRNVFGYTGTYKGVKVSVQASGMGCPSMGIYSYELYSYYDVEAIMRIGSAGAFSKEAKLGDILFAQGVATDSNYAAQYKLPGTYTPSADFHLLETAVATCREIDIPFTVGTVLCSDMFYNDNTSYMKDWQKMGVLAAEMESTALYCNASRLGKKALCMLTVSDQLVTDEHMNTEERQTSFTKMITAALETAIKL
ncbi:MAG: purine-nucleoside phosphorylase [Sphaerochaetaceae bacterium]|nr:purine-nucleoside phosphorylase [Sphaerochaetaceae bacterium]